MNNAEALEQIKKSCNAISMELMRLNPAARGIENAPIKDEMFKTIFELTKQVEAVKKLARKVELSSAGNATELPPEL